MCDQQFDNQTPNQGAQGQFHGPVSFDQRQMTIIHQQIRAAPADPATVAAAQSLLDQLPSEALPARDALPPGSRMPYGRNPHFVGREPDLLAIATALKGGQTTAISQAASVYGLGGVGKTTVATEFVHRYGQYFAGGVFWLSFTDPANIPVEIAQCGGERYMQLFTDEKHLSLTRQVEMVQRAWDEEIPRLLVFDNVDTDEAETLVQHYRPTTGGCRVLITSRRGVWDTSLDVQALPLGVLPRAESIALLRQFRPDLPDADAAAIAAELGDLPLALHLAGSFLKKYAAISQGDPAAFLARLRDPALLEHPALTGRAVGGSWTYHEQSVARAFALSYERLDPADETDTLALALLARAACFAPGEAIPRTLLLTTAKVEDELLMADALERLLALGLLENAASGPTLHCLLARFVQGTAADEDARAAVEVAMLHKAETLNQTGDPRLLSPLQSHLRHILSSSKDIPQVAALCNEMGYHLWMFGNYKEAEFYYEQALGMREQALGTSHLATAQSHNNLGHCLQAQNELPRARIHFEQARVIREQQLGLQHPDTARTIHNIGACLHKQGVLDAAWEYYERALSIRAKMLGEQHPDVAQSLNNMGTLLEQQGNPTEAKPYYERALSIRVGQLGMQHRDTAGSFNNMGTLLYRQGHLTEARAYLEQALEIDEFIHGPDHPEVATDLNNLAWLCYDEGRIAEADNLMRHALIIFTASLGATHPHTQAVQQSLATIEVKLAEQDPPSPEETP